MKHTLLTICLILFALPSWGGTKNTIKIPTHNWSSQVVGAYVLGGIFERLGEKVEYIPADSQGVYNLLSNGQVDIVHEIWEEAFDKSFQVSLKTGNVIDLYTYNFPSIEGWWYPSYLEEKCPGLPDWSALKNCSKLFEESWSSGKGVLYLGPQSWGDYSSKYPDRISKLDLNFTVKHLGSAGAIWEKIEEFYKVKKPLLIFNWTPNFTDAGIGPWKGNFIKFPSYITNDRRYLKLAVHKNFEKNFPKAFYLLKNYNLAVKDMGLMAYYVEVEKMSHQNAAKKWIKENSHRWEKWLRNSENNSSIPENDYVSDLPVCKGSIWTDCFGTHTWDNGNKYVGEWQDDKLNGQGTYTFADGRREVGEWKNGKLNGEAIQYNADGSIYKQGVFKDDEFLYAKRIEPEAPETPKNTQENDYSSATWKCGKEKLWEWSQWKLDLKNNVLRYQFYYKNKDVDFVEEQVARIVKKHANSVTVQRYDKKENSWVKATWKFNYNQDKISTINQFGKQVFYTGCKRIN